MIFKRGLVQTFKRFSTASENVSHVNIKHILNRNCKDMDTLDSSRLLDQSNGRQKAHYVTSMKAN